MVIFGENVSETQNTKIDVTFVILRVIRGIPSKKPPLLLDEDLRMLRNKGPGGLFAKGGGLMLGIPLMSSYFAGLVFCTLWCSWVFLLRASPRSTLNIHLQKISIENFV